MKNLFYVFIISCFLLSCASKSTVVTQSTTNKEINKSNGLYSGGDGSSFEKAVVINATNTSKGIRAEYEYLDKKFGRRGSGYTLVSQTLSSHKGKPYDILTINVKGKEMKFYFDISSFYGKW